MTVDLDGVEILKAGGPIKGIGSPPDGDFYTAADLRAMAAANAELADEVQPPAKIGHFPRSGDPAVGWLENIRADGDRLIADVKKVPKKFAEIVKAGAYRTVSVELGRATSQSKTNDDGTPKVYETVVKGLAFLGAKRPAVQGLSTLDEVVALYEAEDVAAPGDDVSVVVMYATPAAGAVVWDPAASLQAVRNDLQEALNPAGLDGDRSLYVNDVSTDGKALVCLGWDDNDVWVVTFTVADDGTVTPAPSSDWTQAEKTWVATSKAYEEKLAGEKRKPADSRSSMPEQTYTDEHRKAFSEATGIELDKVNDEMLANAGVPAQTPEPAPPVSDAAAGTKEFEERVDKLELELAEERTKRFEAEQEAVIVGEGLRKGRFEPGERDSWEKAYETNPGGTKAAIMRLPANDDLARAFGSEDTGGPVDEEAELMKAYEEQAPSWLGSEEIR